jgi:rhamnulose-1-phosphate aldolase
MKVLKAEFMQGFIRMADDGFRQGWHERNGGNLTYRIKPEEIETIKSNLSYHKPFVNMGVKAANLAGEYFVATGSGKFLRNVALAPQDNLCIVQIDEQGESYRIVWGLEKGGVPTSEFPSHMMNHSVKKEVTAGKHRVIYHAHTPGLIALTFVLPLEDKEFSRILWTMATECPVVFPDGVGVVPWMVPGGSKIALATCELMKKYDVAVWAHHGTFCSGPDFDMTFGLMHTVEKSADIYIRAMSCGQGIRQTISDQNLRDIAKDFHVTLREEFLNTI